MMRCPKLKNRHICKLILYSPAFLWIIVFVVIVIFEDFIPKVFHDVIYITVFLVGGGLGIAYLLLNAIWLIRTDILLEEIRVWKSARMWFETKKNGNDRENAEKRIRNRMKRFGRRCDTTEREVVPSEIRRKFGVSGLSIHWKAIERFCMMYSVPYLDSTEYRKVLSSAIRNVRKLHNGSRKIFLLDKAQKGSPVATAVCVIILADKVADEVADAVIRERIPLPFGEGTACVGDMSCGRYYFNSIREGFYLGIERKSERNYSFDIIKKIVFSGRLPLRENKNYVVLSKRHEELKIYSEKSLWTYLKEEVFPFLKKGKKEIKEDLKIRKMIKNLSDGEVVIIGKEIYCKFRGEVTSRPFAERNSEKREIAVCCFNQWVYPNKRTMSKRDMAEAEKLMKEYLVSKGYIAEFVDFKKFQEKEGDQK